MRGCRDSIAACGKSASSPESEPEPRSSGRAPRSDSDPGRFSDDGCPPDTGPADIPCDSGIPGLITRSSLRCRTLIGETGSDPVPREMPTSSKPPLSNPVPILIEPAPRLHLYPSADGQDWPMWNCSSMDGV